MKVATAVTGPKGRSTRSPRALLPPLTDPPARTTRMPPSSVVDFGRLDSVFSRVAIVNRGEAAMRLIHAVGELNAEGGPRIETVALYTDADAAATFVRKADLGYYLGSAAARPYLDLAVLERALVET